MGRVIAPDLGLANEIIFGGLTIMMIVSALSRPKDGTLAGALRRRAGACCSSLMLTIGLLLLDGANGIALYALAWIVIGIGGALALTAPGLYRRRRTRGSEQQTGHRHPDAVHRPLGRDLLAGPQPAQRASRLADDVRHLRGAAVLHLPAAASLRLPKPVAGHTSGGSAGMPPLHCHRQSQRKAFLLIAAATTISTFVTFGLAPSLLEIFRQSGASPALALQLGSARGVIGISARFMDMLLGKRGNPVLSALMGTGLMVMSFVLMLVTPPSTPLLVSFILLYGFGAGVMAVARALLPLALFSRRDYGLHSARLSLPQNLANAIAPVVFTAILDRSGADAALATCAVLAVIALGFVVMLMALVREAENRFRHCPEPHSRPRCSLVFGSRRVCVSR
jgi:hypothetical protein